MTIITHTHAHPDTRTMACLWGYYLRVSSGRSWVHRALISPDATASSPPLFLRQPPSLSHTHTGRLKAFWLCNIRQQHSRTSGDNFRPTLLRPNCATDWRPSFASFSCSSSHNVCAKRRSSGNVTGPLHIMIGEEHMGTIKMLWFVHFSVSLSNNTIKLTSNCEAMI